MLAIIKGDLDCVNILLDHNVNIIQTCGIGFWSPLISAVHHNNDKIVLALLHAKAPINQTAGTEGINALMMAAKRGHTKCLKILLQHGSLVNEQNEYGETALMMAAQKDHTKCLHLLLHHAADMNKKDNYGMTALMFAAADGNVDCTTYLLNAKASLEITDNWENNALMQSIMQDINPDATCALLIIRAGSPLNQVNSNGDTALSLAILDDNINLITELIEQGANVNQCPNNRTPLWYAANNSYHNSIKVILDAHANPNIGDPPIVQAARYATVDTVKLLLQAGANINSVDSQYGTMMLMGAYMGNYEIVQIGLNARAEINTSPMSFYKPIIYNEHALMLLFAAGENTTYFNYSNDAPETIVQTRTDYTLQNLCRRTIRNDFFAKRPKLDLFQLVPLLPLPKAMKSYLLYNVSF